MTSADAGTMFPAVTHRRVGPVLVVELDDGKANVLGQRTIDGLESAITSVGDASAICLVGRPGYFCAGYDLKEMRSGADNARALAQRGQAFMAMLTGLDLPLVLGVTGHALASGAALALCGDYRVGADGPVRIGFNELANGMPLSRPTVELAVRRLAPTVVDRAVLGSEVMDPGGAQAAGFLDEVVPSEDVVRVAIAHAERLAMPPARAMAATKRRLREARMANPAVQTSGEGAR